MPDRKALRYQLSADQKDALIIHLHRAGWSTHRIGKHLGMSFQGVAKAIHRIKAGRPGRDERE